MGNARRRYVARKAWSTKKYMGMTHLEELQTKNPIQLLASYQLPSGKMNYKIIFTVLAIFDPPTF